MAQLLEFFPKIYAQSTTNNVSTSLDAISQPTIGSINVSTGGSQTSTILLKSTSTATNVGSNFKIRVEIKTNDIVINQYRVVVEFDPTKLQVIDQDSTVQGNQIKNLDTIFLAQTPQNDNTVSNAGRIIFTGKTSDSNPLSINREVLEIEFQAQTIGSTPVRIITGTSGSQLIRQTGAGVSFTGNEVSIQVAAVPTPETNGGAVVNPPVQPNTNTTTNPNVSTLPDTAIDAGASDIIIVAMAILIIGIGTKMGMRKKTEVMN